MGAIEIPSAPRNPGDGVRLFCFTVGLVHMPVAYFLKGEPGDITAPVTAYLIDHPVNGLVLFDTGLGEQFVHPVGEERTHPIADIAYGETIEARLRASQPLISKTNDGWGTVRRCEQK